MAKVMYKIHAQQVNPEYKDKGYIIQFDTLDGALDYLNSLAGFITLSPSGEIGYQPATGYVLNIVRKHTNSYYMVTWNCTEAKHDDGSYITMSDIYQFKHNADEAVKRLASNKNINPRFGENFNIRLEKIEHEEAFNE